MSDPAAMDLVRMFRFISDAVEEDKDRLSELDGAVGDADHGITLSIGFLAVNTALGRGDVESLTASEVLKLAASAFLNAAGATTGPLYASGFMHAAGALEGVTDLRREDQVALLDAIVSGIRQRGKGRRGDRTMLDAWMPALDAAREALQRSASTNEVWREAIAAAESGAEATSAMIALRGRAARLGERALGHLDPGAASAVTVLQAMGQALVRNSADESSRRSAQG